MGVGRFLILSFALLSSFSSSSFGRGRDSAPPRLHLIDGLGKVHHVVTTSRDEAQRWFDQGLALVYGFNHEKAKRAFEQAASLDPSLAMAWWGVALTLGPNYNLPVDAEREKQAYEAIQRAISLQDNASPAERAYIQALAFRYSNDPKADLHNLDVAYRDAMAKLVKQFPDDLDAATLYAESAMNLHPWQLWMRDGRPNEGTDEIVSVLESVLQRDPNHLGANHYYIHALEASPHPERALASAARLEKLAPAAGHLVHMPAHIYSRVGDHNASAHANRVAVAADQNLLRATTADPVYAGMYYSHNLHFLAYADCMRGNFAEAKRAADMLVANVQPRLKEMPMLEGFVVTPLWVLAAFERWDDIARMPPPDQSLVYTTANWHFVRALALAARKRVPEARQESASFRASLGKLPPDAAFDPLNKVTSVAHLQENLVAAALSAAEGKTADAESALRQAIAAEDALNYSEPPSWYPPIRPILGRYLLEQGKAQAAEAVFRQALEKSPRYARALVGLRDTLKAQGRSYDAEEIEQQLRSTSAIDVVSVSGQR